MNSKKFLLILIIFLLNFQTILGNTFVFETNINSDPTQISELPLESNKSKIELNVEVNEENLEFHLNINLKNWVWANTGDGEYKKNHQFIKKIYIGLGTENLLADPIDVIGINLEKDERLDENKLCKNHSLCQIQDFSWCKQSKELKLDPRQHYTLNSLTTENNGNTIFVKFTRRWHTCDNEDLQPSIRPITLWWALKEVPISSELAMIESEIERKNGVPSEELESSTSSSSSVIEIASNKPDRIDLGPLRIENYLKKKLRNQFFRQFSPEFELVNSLIEFGFKGPIKGSLDTLLYDYAENIMILRCDMSREIMDIYAYRCSLQEYLSMRSYNMTMKSDFYITALIQKGKPEDYIPKVKGIVIPICPLKQLKENYEKTSTTEKSIELVSESSAESQAQQVDNDKLIRRMDAILKNITRIRAAAAAGAGSNHTFLSYQLIIFCGLVLSVLAGQNIFNF